MFTSWQNFRGAKFKGKSAVFVLHFTLCSDGNCDYSPASPEPYVCARGCFPWQKAGVWAQGEGEQNQPQGASENNSSDLTCKLALCNNCPCCRQDRLYIFLLPFLFCFSTNKLRMDVQKMRQFQNECYCHKIHINFSHKSDSCWILHYGIISFSATE